MDQGTEIMLQCALTFAQCASFAIPGYGAVIGGGIGVLQTLFTEFTSPTHISYPSISEIGEAISSALTKHDIVLAKDDIGAYYSWYKENYDQAWTMGLSDETEYEADFKRNLHEALAPSTLTKDMIVLMDQDHRLVSWPVFMIGASLHLTLLSKAVLLDSIPKKKIDSPWYSQLVHKYEEYLKQVDLARFQVFKQLQLRLLQVSELESYHTSVLNVNIQTPLEGLRFADNATGEVFDRSWDLAQAMEARNLYRAKVFLDKSEQYFGLPVEVYAMYQGFGMSDSGPVPAEDGRGLPAKYADIVVQWRKDYDRLRKTLPSPKPVHT